MRYPVIIAFILISTIVNSQTCNLEITITNIKSREGIIQIGLYNNKETFPDADGQYKIFYIDASNFSGTYTIKDLPKGEYAVAIYHDKNSDKICNTNFLGIPKEAYGFSKNYRPLLSIPTFNDCKFDLLRNISISIKLIY